MCIRYSKGKHCVISHPTYPCIHMDWLSSGSVGRELAYKAGDVSLGQEDPLQEGMTTHSSVLAWKIPWTEEPCGYTGSQRVRHKGSS